MSGWQSEGPEQAGKHMGFSRLSPFATSTRSGLYVPVPGLGSPVRLLCSRLLSLIPLCCSDHGLERVPMWLHADHREAPG